MKIIPNFVEGIFREFGPQIQARQSEAYEEIQGIAEALDYDFTQALILNYLYEF